MWDIYAYFLLLILCLATWLRNYKSIQAGLRILGYALLITLLIEGYAAFLMFKKTNNFYIYHLLIPIQYFLYSLVFYKELQGRLVRKAILYSIPLYLFLSGILLLFQETSEVNTYARLLKNILLIGWPLLYYREVFIGLKINRLEKEPMFWISTGLLFYSLGNFFVDGLMNLILEESYELAHMLYYIKVFLGLILYITFLISYLISHREANGIASGEVST